MNPTRRSLLGTGMSLAVLSAFAKAGAMKPESSKHARDELEGAVHGGFTPGLVGLVARGDDVDVMTAGRMALDGPPMRRAPSSRRRPRR